MTRLPDPSSTIRHLARLYSPPPSRALLSTLCEIEAEIRQSLAVSHEVAHTRLEWWREECERTVSGAAAHPLTRKLLELSPREPLEDLAGLVDTTVWDLAGATFETRREVNAYCTRWAAALVEPVAMQAQAGSGLAPAAPPRWRALGAALREIELLTQLPQEARQGRLRLPLDELARAGVPTEQLSAEVCSPALATLLTTRHETLRRTLEAAVLDIAPGLQPHTRGLLVWVQLMWRCSRQAQLALPRMQPPPGGGVGMAWAAWRAARTAQRQAYRLEYRP